MQQTRGELQPRLDYLHATNACGKIKRMIFDFSSQIIVLREQDQLDDLVKDLVEYTKVDRLSRCCRRRLRHRG
jgi:hypothetical protein